MQYRLMFMQRKYTRWFMVGVMLVITILMADDCGCGHPNDTGWR